MRRPEPKKPEVRAIGGNFVYVFFFNISRRGKCLDLHIWRVKKRC